MALSASDFLGSAPAASSDASTSEEAPQEPYGVSRVVTPAGIEVYYQAGPKRLYRVRAAGGSDAAVGRPLAVDVDATDWIEVPSVSTVLGVLDKSGALTWWGMKIGVAGVLELIERGRLRFAHDADLSQLLIVEGGPDGSHLATVEMIVGDSELGIKGLLTEERLTVNHMRDKAADRGTDVHSVFESWSETGLLPQPEVFPEEQRGYAVALRAFIEDLGGLENLEDIQSEVMVGSLEHGFAGRYDLRFTLKTPRTVVRRIFPKKAPVVEEIPAGRYLADLKTSKGVYSSHALQLRGYDVASVECGYEPVDRMAVIHTAADGRYELRFADAPAEAFLSVLETHGHMQNEKGWIS